LKSESVESYQRDALTMPPLSMRIYRLEFVISMFMVVVISVKEQLTICGDLI